MKDILSTLLVHDEDHDGPRELSAYRDFFAPIGEFVIAFSRLERRQTWAIESILRLTIQEANSIEEIVKNFSSRTKLLFAVSSTKAMEGSEKDALVAIVEQIERHNAFRNSILHGPWPGLSISITDNKIGTVSAMKYRPHWDPSKPDKQRLHTVDEIRVEARSVLNTCRDIQRWVLAICPNAENRVP